MKLKLEQFIFQTWVREFINEVISSTLHYDIRNNRINCVTTTTNPDRIKLISDLFTQAITDLEIESNLHTILTKLLFKGESNGVRTNGNFTYTLYDLYLRNRISFDNATEISDLLGIPNSAMTFSTNCETVTYGNDVISHNTIVLDPKLLDNSKISTELSLKVSEIIVKSMKEIYKNNLSAFGKLLYFFKLKLFPTQMIISLNNSKVLIDHMIEEDKLFKNSFGERMKSFSEQKNESEISQELKSSLRKPTKTTINK